MVKNILIIATFIVGLAGCSQTPQEQQPENLGSLFIIGGGSRSDSLVNCMIDEAGLRDTGYLVILPMSSSMPDSAIIWSGEQFINNGIQKVVGFNFTENGQISPQRLDSLRNASLIYISGGDQNRFMDIVGGTEIETAIHDAFAKGAMIAGTSAGAAVMSQKMITGDELREREYSETFRTIESENLELAKGLGLINTAIIDQHFIQRSRHNRLITAVIENPELAGIGIDESTAILVKGNQAEVVGEAQVMVFSNPEKSYNEQKGKLGAQNLKINIYLPGEKFIIP